MPFNENLISSALRGVSGSAIRDIFKLLNKPGMISFAGGNPSMRALEPDAVKAVACEAIDRYGAAILQYGATEGLPELRRAHGAISVADGGRALHGGKHTAGTGLVAGI